MGSSASESVAARKTVAADAESSPRARARRAARDQVLVGAVSVTEVGEVQVGQRASAASAEDRSASVAGSVSSAGQWYVVLVDRGRSRASDGVLLARPIDYGSGISARALGPQQQAYVGKSVRLEGPREQPALCATVCEILDRVVIHLDRNARFVSTASSEGWPGLTFSACSCSMSTLTLESLPTRLEKDRKSVV